MEMAARCASTRIERRAASSPPTLGADCAGERVYAGWLFVEAHAKREFKFRYCVLDGVWFQVYGREIDLNRRTCDDARASFISEHHLVHVERLHRLNRGMLLIGRDGYGLWIHGTHDPAYFEQWLGLIVNAVAAEPIRVTISRYGFSHQSSVVSNVPAKTGWLIARHVFVGGWLVGPGRRKYCVLSGRCLSLFALDMEGRWAAVSGKIKTLSRTSCGKWLRLNLDDDRTKLHLAGRSASVTDVWERQILSAIACNRVCVPVVDKVAAQPPRRILTC